MRWPAFIPDWRQSWRFHSVRAAAVLAALSLVQAEVLPNVQAIVPAKYWPWVVAAFAIAIGFFRILAQNELREQQQQERK